MKKTKEEIIEAICCLESIIKSKEDMVNLFSDEIHNHDCELSNLKKELESLNKPKRWKPEIGEIYFCVYNGNALPSNWRSDKVDDFRYNSRNCFKTKEEAEIELERILFVNEVRDFIEEENEGWEPGWEPDWNDDYQKKYRLCYDGSSFYKAENDKCKETSDYKYFLNYYTFEKILAKFDNEKLKNWWI